MESSAVSFNPNIAQKAAILHKPSPLMILAGAGTGKTTTLLNRILYLVQKEDVPPENIILLTFTDKTTSEITRRIKELIGSSADKITISTFHGFCNALVREQNISPNAEKILWQKDDIIYFFINHFDELKFISSSSFLASPYTAITKSFIPFIDRIRDELLTPDQLNDLYQSTNILEKNFHELFPNMHKDCDYVDCINQLSDLIKIFDYFQKEKNKMGVVDYGDMILDCWNMLNSSSTVLNNTRKKYKHIFIDEYQDNNYALNKIINFIAGHKPSITVVGDEDQCIYSFRGANYYNIKDFEKRYSSFPNYKMVKLVENYRSSSEILDLANASIKYNTQREEKSLIRPKELPKNGPKPKWYVSESKESMNQIPQLIHDMVEMNNRVFGDIAIICRSWGHIKNLASVLQKSAIPVDIHIEKFFNVPIVKDVLAWGHLVIADERSEAALFRILKDKMGYEWTSKFYSKLNKTSIDERLNALEKLSIKFPDILWVLSTREKMLRSYKKKQGPDEIIWDILKHLKDAPEIQHLRKNYRYKQRLNLANMAKLMLIAERFNAIEENPTLKSWLQYMNILQRNMNIEAAQPEEYNKNAAVQILTAHQSKGLEFPIVIIPFLRSGSFPIRFNKTKIIDELPIKWKHWFNENPISVEEFHIQEERRIFHVACTRAKDELYLFGPSKAQSIFTKELDSLEPKIMENSIMKISDEAVIQPELNSEKQQLLVDLSHEIAANHYDNASEVLSKMKKLNENPTKEDSNKLDPRYLLKLSASSINDYESCPYKYRLKHIDKVPERKTRATMEFGIIIHNVLDEFHGKGNQSLKQMMDLLDKHWRKDAFEYLLREEEFKKQAIELVEAYFNYNKEHPSIVVAREKMFNFTIDELQVVISGKIDRIDQEGNSLSVIDYKTSKNKEKAKGNLQLALYTEALKRDAVEDVKGNPGTTILHFLRHYEDPLESHTFTSDDLSKELEKVSKVAEGIRKNEFQTKPGDFNCQNCDYRQFLCPAWEED
tara:strand:- start:1359 stop:4367 length:3009 start_codon:yes stop_codon:yes gene_type:complete